jgi:hypothetical protein
MMTDFACIRDTLVQFAFAIDNPHESKSAGESLRELQRVLAPLQFAEVKYRKPSSGNVEKYVVHAPLGCSNHYPTACYRNASDAKSKSWRPRQFEDIEICHEQRGQYFGFANTFNDFNVRSFSEIDIKNKVYDIENRSRRKKRNLPTTAFFHGQRRTFLNGVTFLDEAVLSTGVYTQPLVPFFQLTPEPPALHDHAAPRIGEIICGVIGECPETHKREFLCWTPVSPQFVRLVQLIRYGPSHPTFRMHEEAGILHSLVFPHPYDGGIVSPTYEHSATLASPFVYALIALPLVFRKRLIEPVVWRSPLVSSGRIELQAYFIHFVSYITVLERALNANAASAPVRHYRQHQPFTLIVPTSVADRLLLTPATSQTEGSEEARSDVTTSDMDQEVVDT